MKYVVLLRLIFTYKDDLYIENKRSQKFNMHMSYMYTNDFLEYSPSIIDKCRSQQLLCHQRVLIFKDITDGLLYKNLSVKVHQGVTANDTYVIMLMLNTDGAPVFKSQNYSIWPLYASVLELAPEKR